VKNGLASLCLCATLILQIGQTNMENPQKQQVAERLKTANNILVTVSSNPSVDQLAACIGLTLALNKMGKHATAVFSGQVPSTIEFLQPEKTIEKNTDSLRDFIIALDKSKADKLRYKVEDKVVKIFITPYKTSISEKDLNFSQGDFNVDVVVALGVHNQADLDQAITAHGRILHDAVVATLNVKPGGEIGTLNWLDAGASSLSELAAELINAIDKKVIDGQMATSLLTGIVAETARFGNAKTSPQTMSISAELMMAGANQQLVATKLEPKPAPPPPPPQPKIQAEPPKPAAGSLAMPTQPTAQAKATEGTLEIDHGAKTLSDLEQPEEEKEPLTPQIDIDREGTLHRLEQGQTAASLPPVPPAQPDPNAHLASSRMVLQPPTMGGAMSANAADPLSLPQPGEAMDSMDDRPSGAPPLGGVNMPGMPTPNPTGSITPTPEPPPLSFSTPTSDDRTLTQIEQSVDSLHLTPPPSTPPEPMSPTGGHLSSARDAVTQAINSQPSGRPPEPIAALNAQPVNLPLRDESPPSGFGAAPPIPNGPPSFQPPSVDPTAPPPLPPPMMPPPSQ
jgi:hypothetical protein